MTSTIATNSGPDGDGGVIAAPVLLCHDCDQPHALPDPADGQGISGQQAICSRCGAVLRKYRSGGIEWALALNGAAAILFTMANLFPLLTFQLEGRAQSATLGSGAAALWQGGYPILGVLVAVVLLFTPVIEMTGLLYVLGPLSRGRVPPAAAKVFRLVRQLRPWSMSEVFLLGMIVAYVKLSDMATLIPGASLVALVVFIMTRIWADSVLSAHEVWDRIQPQTRLPTSGPLPDLVLCHDCGQAVTSPWSGLGPVSGVPHCPRCGAVLHRRKPGSIRRCWALLITALVLYIPANLLPIMTVIYFGAGEPDTIMSGIRTLIAAQMWPVAALVFFASIFVPVLKLAGLAWLLVTVQRRSAKAPRDRTAIYRLIEGIGRWSMVDIFMISILVALVKLGAIASVEAALGSVAFASVVIVTMIASHAFDPRLIWDSASENARD